MASRKPPARRPPRQGSLGVPVGEGRKSLHCPSSFSSVFRDLLSQPAVEPSHCDFPRGQDSVSSAPSLRGSACSWQQTWHVSQGHLIIYILSRIEAAFQEEVLRIEVGGLGATPLAMKCARGTVQAEVHFSIP